MVIPTCNLLGTLLIITQMYIICIHIGIYKFYDKNLQWICM